MKTVALTVASPSLDERVDSRFGRAAYLLFVDPKTMTWDSVANPGKDDGSGAGIRVAQLLSDRKVTDVISGHFGPKAKDALDLAEIRLHHCGSRTTAREAVVLMNSGKLGGSEPAESRGREEGGGQGGSGGRGRGLGRGRGGRGR